MIKRYDVLLNENTLYSYIVGVTIIEALTRLTLGPLFSFFSDRERVSV